MTTPEIASIEEQIGRRLPEAYRTFLATHTSRYLDPPWLVRTVDTIPGGGPEEFLRSLTTAAELIAEGLIGEVEPGMLVVGDIEPGGYLYLSVGSNRPGAFFARFPFSDPNFYLVAASFEDLLARSRPDTDQ